MNLKIIKKIITGTIICGIGIYAQQMVIPTFQQIEVIPGVAYQRLPATIIADLQPYTQGGVTFTYASGTFTEAPIVSVTLQMLDMSFSTTTLLSAVVVSNSATQTVVQVGYFDSTLGTIQEAANNSVIVHISARGS